MQRPVDVREPRDSFLIVCEGEKTEPNYFRAFRVVSAKVEVLGLGKNTRSLVEAAIEEKNKDQYDQVWCVFDRDSFPPDQFNAALTLAERNGMKVAYSNEAFEIWYLLHFHYYDAAMSRSDYCKKLSGLLGFEYKKNSPDMHENLLLRQEAAIKNAKRLLAQYNPPNPEEDNPSTTVFELVEELNKFIQ